MKHILFINLNVFKNIKIKKNTFFNANFFFVGSKKKADSRLKFVDFQYFLVKILYFKFLI